MRFLGIDYGAKRVGVAFSDEEGSIAFPHAVLPNDKNITAALAALCRERGVSTVIVGDSRNFMGVPNRIAPAIEKFKTELAGATGLPIHAEPEFLTSVQAGRWQGKTEK